jgi:hypothetical protein
MFVNPFRSENHPEEADFRTRVLKFAFAQFPGTSISAAADKDVIIVGDVRIGLQNLKAKFDQSDCSDETFETLALQHITFALEDHSGILDFASVRARLRPQIMPPEFAVQAPILSFPFGETLAVGIVIDGDKGYSYVRTEDAIQWKTSREDLLSLSIANLDEAIRGKTKMQFFEEGATTWVGIEMKDGFDAARILIPAFRKFLATRLGSPFYFGVPNRDFLIAWNGTADASFAESAASKIKRDFKTQPYPLSPSVFEVELGDTIIERVK